MYEITDSNEIPAQINVINKHIDTFSVIAIDWM